MSECRICGEYECKKHSFLISKFQPISKFSGSSPPEIFVGKWNYPNVYTGILSPQEYGNNEIMSSPEEWHKSKLPISKILELRNKLIYGRKQKNIRSVATDKQFLPVMQEIAMSEKSVSTEFHLEKPITQNPEKEPKAPLISKATSVKKVRIEENVSVKKKVDYLVNDIDVKSSQALFELEKSTNTSTMIKLLSAGLLGLKKNRKLVPTRWSITAVDDTLSKNKLKSIKFFPEISEFLVFSAEYLGNHYEFLLLPEKFSFEVIEISLKNKGVWHDHETFFERKKYAESVTGAYYSNRLALTEYLERTKKQASCIVFREILPSYTVPLGVGILRETSREAFGKQPFKFQTLKDALENIQQRIKQPLLNFTEKSIILKNFGKQKRISDFF